MREQKHHVAQFPIAESGVGRGPDRGVGVEARIEQFCADFRRLCRPAVAAHSGGDARRLEVPA